MATNNDSVSARRPGYHAWFLGLQLMAAGVILALSGCSTSPCADVLDFCSPGRIPPNADVTGGVCIPQGGQVGGAIGAPPIPGAAPIIPGGPGPAPVFGPPGVADMPPPAPVGVSPFTPLPK
jgi:hypothetical protein